MLDDLREFVLEYFNRTKVKVQNKTVGSLQGKHLHVFDNMKTLARKVHSKDTERRDKRDKRNKRNQQT